MRTFEFVKNEENVEARRNIKQFGEAAIKYNMNRSECEVEKVPFTIYTTEHEEVENVCTEKYVPSTTLHTDFMPKYDEVSIKISNIPLDVTREELTEYFRKKNPEEYFRINLVCEKREEGADYSVKTKSRGFAYIAVVDEATAKKIISSTGDVIMRDFKLNLEIVYR